MYNFSFSCSFFFNDTATTEIYTLSLHDALPIFIIKDSENFYNRFIIVSKSGIEVFYDKRHLFRMAGENDFYTPDRKSTRLNSSHSQISYAVFCLKKKKK